MQPLDLAEQTRQGAADFLATTFPACGAVGGGVGTGPASGNRITE